MEEQKMNKKHAKELLNMHAPFILSFKRKGKKTECYIAALLVGTGESKGEAFGEFFYSAYKNELKEVKTDKHDDLLLAFDRMSLLGYEIVTCIMRDEVVSIINKREIK